ncbi:PREDICTED: uncharacterized protein LOC108370479 [Rhagoletis zephyria]|uniref:uncharacterized protein LOC108370479 n=1 Tax=Rhagoletis zephyria TaxID=28612 RepID=UPI0008118190|nr:PREDICTED: uncharacterized protein LOC108370479 [Rhagoletis zephyria]
MAEARGQYQKLPPGWDCKYDQATGNCYYINYFTKAMQLEDPRSRYKQLQNERCSNESIAMQPVQHGSPYHVYPSNNLPAVRAFQAGPGTNTSLHNMSSSPLLSSRGNLEMSPLPLPRSSLTQTPRLGNMSRRSTIQETSFTNPIDTDAVVNKIQNIFPTASEDHIRLLLKKYLKTIFPKADEMVLLDILASSDNNVQTASEKLISMGYTKRDFIPPKTTHRFDAEHAHAGAVKKPGDETIIPLRPKEYTIEEKAAIQAQLKEKYPQTADRIILMALESVNYAEDRAIQILHIVQEEDELDARKHAAAAIALTSAGGEAEVLLGASGMQGTLADNNAAEDNIITVVLTPSPNTYSDNVKSRHNASVKDIPHTTISYSSPLTSSTATTTTTSSSSSASSSVPPLLLTSSTLKSSTKINAIRNIGKKVAFPSINLTTPTTATTQIILSNSPTCNIEHNEEQLPATTFATSDAVDPLKNSYTNISSSATQSTPSISPSEALKELCISHEPTAASTSLSVPSSLSTEPAKYQTITTKSILARCNAYATRINGYLHGTPCSTKTSTITSASTRTTTASILDNLKAARLSEKTDSLKALQKDSVDKLSDFKQRKEFNSILGRITTTGHSAELAKGADESLLLADYVTWNGANPDMPQGNNQKQLANGPDASKLCERTYKPMGRNPELCKGAQKGLAKGSIYAQLAASGNTNTANIKCN